MYMCYITFMYNVYTCSAYMRISMNHNSLGCKQPSRPRCRTITQCAGHVSANARPLQLRWGDRECGCFTCTPISINNGQVQHIQMGGERGRGRGERRRGRGESWGRGREKGRETRSVYLSMCSCMCMQLCVCIHFLIVT